MKIKLILLLVIGASLGACSSSEEIPSYEVNSESIYEAPNPETYSEEKQAYCKETDNESFCSCQFDVLDPILTSAIGSNWSTKAMEEEDFPTYVSAVEAAVAQCT